MKKLCTVFFIMGLAVVAQGQGTVTFANAAATQIRTNDFINAGPMSAPAGEFLFELDIAPFGSPPNTALMTGTNLGGGLGIGRFNGGNGTAPFPAGTQVSFQVHGWSSMYGNNFNTAYTAWSTMPWLHGFLGSSAQGFFTVPASGSVILFGASPGQVGGFDMFLVTPEPSTYALVVLGWLVWATRRTWLSRR
jgi:hypothetical protein